MESLIQVKNLTIDFQLERGNLRACDNASIEINKNEIIGIIGESGSGKSTLASGILNLVQSPGKISGGEVLFNIGDGKMVDLLKL
ncbi:MAG: ATP-binding cassette domain-containing protein, partial [Clostridium celatum]|nr:ATP-binding cassette domain-containing protein [Clostridium celatum]